MNRKKIIRQIVAELPWLMASAALSVLICIALFDTAFPDSVDIHIHDTMFVLVSTNVTLPVFTLLLFFVYFIRGTRQSFQMALPNWIFLLAGFALLVGLSWLNTFFAQEFRGEWVAYPPLSALEDDVISKTERSPLTNRIINILVVIQVVIVAMMIFAAFCWGKSKRTKG